MDWLFLHLFNIILEVHHDVLQAVINMEPLDSSQGVHGDLTVSVKLDDACVQHVVKLLGSSCVFYSSVLSLLDPGPQACQLFHILLELLLLHDLLLLLLLYLVLGASSLAAYLQQVSADTLLHFY